MDSHQLMMKEKLDFSGIFKQTLKLPLRYPNFVLLFLITSFPLFFFLLLQEIIFQQPLIQALKLTRVPPHHPDLIPILIENFSATCLSSSLLLFGIIHLLDLLNTIITVYTASVMYAGEANPLSLKQMLRTPIKKVGFRGPLITSLCALVLSSLTSIGLAFLAMPIGIHVTTDDDLSWPWHLFILVLGVIFVAQLTKHIEWSAVWNMSVVMSILEEKHGDAAIGICWYLSRGSRKRGFLLSFVFFAWKIASRISCLYYVGWHRGGVGNMVQVIAGKVCLDCVGNFMMWVGLVIYFYDCKRRLLEKKFDGAEGRVAQIAKV